MLYIIGVLTIDYAAGGKMFAGRDERPVSNILSNGANSIKEMSSFHASRSDISAKPTQLFLTPFPIKRAKYHPSCTLAGRIDLFVHIVYPLCWQALLTVHRTRGTNNMHKYVTISNNGD